MYVIINTGNGNYYTSAVFGYYEDNPSRFGSYEEYYIVLDEKKEKLVKKWVQIILYLWMEQMSVLKVVMGIEY